MSAWRHARAIVLLPGMAALAVPAWILLTADDAEVSRGAVIGVPLMVVGLALWAWTVRLLARVGKGTLAPWDPTQRLVVEGPYRHTRSPMITAVLAILLGEAALFGSLSLLVWAGAFLAINWIWFVLVEEPGLERRFGAEYADYKRRVPRWLPFS